MKVFAYETFGRVEYGRYFVGLLRRLGYRASLRILPAEDYFGHTADSRNRAQIGPIGWYADTASPSLFLRDLFSCASFVPESSTNHNWSEFCDHAIDAEMRRAAAVQASDPVRSNDIWAGVDHALVDRAAAVPILNQYPVAFVSGRVGNYQFHPQWATLFDQLWVE